MVAASEALGLGYGGLSRVTITKGVQELHAEPLALGRIRRPGAGRPRRTARDPTLLQDLEALVEPLTRGDPESPLRWTCKSTRTLAQELSAQDHPVSHEKVAQLLRSRDYSLQGNRKTQEGEDPPDRDAQFQYINEQVRRALTAHRLGDLALQPVNGEVHLGDADRVAVLLLAVEDDLLGCILALMLDEMTRLNEHAARAGGRVEYDAMIGLDVALEALRDCLQSRKCTRDQLWQYAKICRVTEVMRPYLEALS